MASQPTPRRPEGDPPSGTAYEFDNDPRVTVVVTTRNSAEHLERCLQSIRAQTHANVELVVVDNYSTDRTFEIAQRYADTPMLAGPERSAQRNAGARAAGGRFLLFVDSDMVLDPTVVEQCIEAVVERGARAVVIPERSFGEGFWARCKALERSCYMGDETIEAARFFERGCFFSVDGFDEGLPAGPEDWDLHERVRSSGTVMNRTRAEIHHDEGRLNLRKLAAKKFYYGKGMGLYMSRHPELARRQLRLVRPAFVRHWRVLAAHPGLLAGVVVMKSCEFGAGAAGLISTKARRS
jgi:glycosyltransferase involved in cell wall biosynthesis